jgi:hypothetical protein
LIAAAHSHDDVRLRSELSGQQLRPAIGVACASIALIISSGGSAAAASGTPAPPSATTGAATNVAQSSATVAGTVNPNGVTTAYYFQYGTSTSYGSSTPSTDAGSGTADAPVSANLTGLASTTTYHYRLVAVSSAGTTDAADQTLATTSSEAVVMGHEGFVSPGRVVGVELGCFHGTSTCAGQLTMTHDGTVIAQRNYSIPADSGGFQNMVLSWPGQGMLGSNGVWHLLPVTVTAKGSTGQTLSFVIHLARWVWH